MYQYHLLFLQCINKLLCYYLSVKRYCVRLYIYMFQIRSFKDVFLWLV